MRQARSPYIFLFCLSLLFLSILYIYKIYPQPPLDDSTVFDSASTDYFLLDGTHQEESSTSSVNLEVKRIDVSAHQVDELSTSDESQVKFLSESEVYRNEYLKELEENARRLNTFIERRDPYPDSEYEILTATRLQCSDCVASIAEGTSESVLTLLSTSDNVIPSLSSDSKTILYTDNGGNLMSYNITDATSTTVKKYGNRKLGIGNDFFFPYKAISSPDGKYIGVSFVIYESSGFAIIETETNKFYTIELDFGPFDFAWSSDSREFVLGVTHDSFSDLPASLYKGNVDDLSEETYIIDPETSSENDIREPSWSPDNSKIAFSHKDTSDKDFFELYTIAADGKQLVRQTHHEGTVSSPIWLNTLEILYALSDVLNPGIYTINISTGVNTEILSLGNKKYVLSGLSPDRNILVYRVYDINSQNIVTENQLFAYNFLTSDTILLGEETYFVGWLPKK